MINKKSLWFLTLFSLILVLSVYYITMPSELLLNKNVDITTKKKSKKKSSKESVIETMRIEDDNKMNEELDSLQVVLKSDKSSKDEKNEAYEKIKTINNTKAEEEALEDKIKKEFKFESYVKITDDKIKVVVKEKKHDTTLANKIIRSIQSNYETSKYITVQFE